MASLGQVGLAALFVNLIGLAAVPAAAQTSSAGCTSRPSVVSSPSPGKVGNQLSGVVTLSASDAWAVGGASTPTGNPPSLLTVPLVMRWNGTGWHLVHNPLAGAGALSSVAAVSPGDVWAVGHQGSTDAGTPLTEHWNGSAWSVVPSPMIAQGYLLGVSAVSSNDVWAVGIRLGSVSYGLIEHWNGSTWSVFHSPNPGADYNEIDSVVAISRADAWAVGSAQSSNVSSGMLAHWDGSRWTLAKNPATPQADSVLRGVAAQSAADIWAVGQTRSPDGSITQTLVEHSDGHGWTVVRSPSPTQQSRLNAVAVAGGTVWTVGVQSDGSTNRTLIERADLGQFNVVRSPNRGLGGNDLEGIATAMDGSAWAVGSDQGATRGQSLVLAVC